jgi:hypothetical protein
MYCVSAYHAATVWCDSIPLLDGLVSHHEGTMCSATHLGVSGSTQKKNRTYVCVQPCSPDTSVQCESQMGASCLTLK